MELENVLAKVTGAHVSAAKRALPPADTDAAEERTTDYDVPGLGLVRFYFKRMTSKKGKSRHTFWTAERAVVVAQDC
jgi:hypothetical protein